ncbi:MAG: hypothetical protein AABY97_03280 [Chloroflexota bacterium]
MLNTLGFDLAAAHRFFSVDCFTKAWELIEKPSRASEEDQEMIRLNQVSLWHWTQREDCTDRNLSIGYWQASRIHALLRQSENSLRYGQLSLEHSSEQDPFTRGYAYEALARDEAESRQSEAGGRVRGGSPPLRRAGSG